MGERKGETEQESLVLEALEKWPQDGAYSCVVKGHEMSERVKRRLFEFTKQSQLGDEPSEWDTLPGEIFVRKIGLRFP